ncbi:MAG: TolC family protein [Polyangiaceae bacterium]
MSIALALTATFIGASAHAEGLSADQAVARAARDNPSLRATEYDVRAAQEGVRAEKHDRDPTLTTNASGQYAETLNVGGDTASRRASAGIGVDSSLTYTTDYGTSLEWGVSSDLTWASTTSTELFGPVYATNTYFTLRQPLLRGAGRDLILAPLRQAELGQTSATKDRELATSQTVLAVLQAYWELWYARRATTVEEAALELAKRQLADAKAKVEVLGTGANVDVLQFASSVAAINESLASTRANEKTRAIELGRLLGLAPDKSLELTATDSEPSLGTLPSAATLVEALVERSPELAAMRADLETLESRVAVATNARKPRVDLFSTVSMGAAWTDDDLPGLQLPGNAPAFAVLGGVTFELPLGGGRAPADLARAQAQLDAARARYQARVDAITSDVAKLGVALDTASEQAKLAGETADLSEKLAQAQRERFSIGVISSADVVKAEQDAREAELRRLRAIVDRASTTFALENAAGTLLARFSEVLAQGAGSGAGS